MKYDIMNWEKVYVSGICTGVGIKVTGSYYKMICNTILPNTDAEYAKERDEIEQDMDLICEAPEMLEALKDCLLWIDGNNHDLFNKIESIIKKIEE